MHILGAGQQPRRLLEGAVGGERHPVRGKIVRHVDGGAGWAFVEHRGASSHFRRGGLRGTLSASGGGGNGQWPAIMQVKCAVSGTRRGLLSRWPAGTYPPYGRQTQKTLEAPRPPAARA